MSHVGFNSLNPAILASSVSGGQQVRSGRNEAAQASSGQDFRSTIEALNSRQSGDVSEASLESDRDADGREALGGEDESTDQHEAALKNLERLHDSRRCPDAEQICGNILDLDG
ncbi:hypothetical protein [Rubinisphaera margarita]|uniref:hypothetical protein n=1 Tax=Rubinisphaera margarita TaxID=2909586 RepID=UPI001EE93EE8|nr:hypothetical protein [Rubinisphaera margarita]MCG6156646.1 hypothetical protein [Rubinisphaera margarita]